MIHILNPKHIENITSDSLELRPFIEIIWLDKENILQYAFLQACYKEQERIDFVKETLKRPSRSAFVITTSYVKDIEQIYVGQVGPFFIAQDSGNFTLIETKNIINVFELVKQEISNATLRSLISVRLGNKCVFGFFDKQGEFHTEYHGKFFEHPFGLSTEESKIKQQKVETKAEQQVLDVHIQGVKEDVYDIYKYTKTASGKIITRTNKERKCSYCQMSLGNGDDFYGILMWDEAARENDLICSDCYNWFVEHPKKESKIA